MKSGRVLSPCMVSVGVPARTIGGLVIGDLMHAEVSCAIVVCNFCMQRAAIIAHKTTALAKDLSEEAENFLVCVDVQTRNEGKTAKLLYDILLY